MQRFLKVTAAVAMLSVSALAFAGSMRGPTEDRDVIGPRQIITYSTAFVGGEVAQVRVRSYGNTFLAVVVYDENGSEIVGDTDKSGGDILLTWRPRWTGVFKVKIGNPASVSNTYYYSHN